MEYETLLYEVLDNIGVITLNRPEAANSINLTMARELMDCTLNCSEDPAVHAVLITDTGKMFCSGGDLKTFAAQGKDLPRYMKETTTYLHAAVSRLMHMDSPIIAAVNGSVGGAGMSLVCSCDMVISAESARLTVGYTRAGLTPDGGLTYSLSRIVGLRRALELVLTNRVLSAREACDYGLVTRTVSDKEVFEQAFSLASEIAAGATKALGRAKQLLHNGWTQTLEMQMQDASEAIAEMARTADGQEGINAFIEKRTPQFNGS